MHEISKSTPAPKSIEQEYYGSTARHYDPAYAADQHLADVPFYVELARSANGRVLEVACGTGRILLPTARAGVTIDGLDFSPQLLSILREKMAREPFEVQQRVNLYEGDMRSFALNAQYDLITIPFRPLQHLFTVADQLAAFNCVAAHLKKGGKFGFNVFFPNYALLDEVGKETHELEWADPQDPTVTVKRAFVRKKLDKLNQYFEGEFIFRSYRGDTQVTEERSALRMSYYTYPHLQLLLKAAGFKILEQYGSFAREPIDICKEMIFVAEKQ